MTTGEGSSGTHSGYVRRPGHHDWFSLRTRTEAVALALQHLAVQPMTRDEALPMRGARAIDDLPAGRDRRAV